MLTKNACRHGHLLQNCLSLANSTTNRNKLISVALTKEVKATLAFFTMVGIFS